MEEKGPHIYRGMNCSNRYCTTSPFTNRETDAQGGQSWALETGLPVPGAQVSSTARPHPLPSYKWVQTSAFLVRRTHFLAMELNWPWFSISGSSPLFRLGNIEVSGLKPGKVLTKNSKSEKTLNILWRSRGEAAYLSRIGRGPSSHPAHCGRISLESRTGLSLGRAWDPPPCPPAGLPLHHGGSLTLVQTHTGK